MGGSEILPFDKVTSIVAAVSSIGFVLLLPLYLSSRRDLVRLREWAREDPGFAATNLVASESLLDRHELTLEHIYAERGDPVPGTAEFPAVTDVHDPVTATAIRVTSERPALERVTMERAALVPHPRWRRFVGRASQPRWLVAIAAVALLAAGTAIVASDRLLSSDDDSGLANSGDTSGIVVSVLNSTGTGNAAGRTAERIEQAGFLPGTIAGIARDSDQSVVMYAPGRKRDARRVAKELGGSIPLQALTQEVQSVSGDASVVVILGEDQAGG